MGRPLTSFGMGGNSMLLAAAFAVMTGAAAFANQDHAMSSHPHAHQESAMSKLPAPADGAICHKDHAGLDLAAAETTAGATARLFGALDDGGALVVASIEGLSCAFCADAIEEAFAERKEVSAAFVNTRDGTISIAVKAGAELDDKTIRKLIKRRGYGVGEIRHNAVHAGAPPPVFAPE